jgi:hypothetical protein
VIHLNKKSDSGVKEITYIAVGVAAMIAGGVVIFQLSLVVPIPGVKYILMAPYLSMVIYILLSKVKTNYALIKIGCVFGLIMMIMNLYMGLTIIATALLSQLSISPIQHQSKAFYGAVLFSAYAGICALVISKYLVGGIFKEISFLWLIATGLICAAFGIIGTILAKKIMKHLMKYSYEQ